MKCSKCGADLSDDAKFCSYCGEKMKAAASMSGAVEGLQQLFKSAVDELKSENVKTVKVNKLIADKLKKKREDKPVEDKIKKRNADKPVADKLKKRSADKLVTDKSKKKRDDKLKKAKVGKSIEGMLEKQGAKARGRSRKHRKMTTVMLVLFLFLCLAALGRNSDTSDSEALTEISEPEYEAPIEAAPVSGNVQSGDEETSVSSNTQDNAVETSVSSNAQDSVVEKPVSSNAQSNTAEKPTTPKVSKPTYSVTDMTAVMYATSTTYVRKGPDTKESKLGTLSQNEKVAITGKVDNGWYKIKYNGVAGFVKGDSLSTQQLVVQEAPPTQKNESADSQLNNGTPQNGASPGNVSTPDNSGAPGNVGSPDNSGAPGNVGSPVNSGAPGNVGSPDNSGAPGNVSTPDNSSAPGNGSAPAVTVPSVGDTEGNLVWIPTKGGKRYHISSSCSNMDNPMQVTVEHAATLGFTPCGRCY